MQQTGSFRAQNTRVIESVDDLEGFSEIEAEDQEMLRRIIAGTEELSELSLDM